ncbi:hypothetical protein JW935_22595 [candidate division KSB1 bacterium]|nr:hypothetical protein [candidate division KSB1 bacterium]
MKKLYWIVLAGLFMGCAAGLSGFMEPAADDTMLIVGRAILEDNYYTEEIGVYKQDIEVAILGKTSEGKTLALWATTDENGYFAVANAPRGEYAVKGIRTLIGTGSLVTITNRLRLSTDVYMISSRPQVLFNGQYFPFEPVGRIASLQHNIFQLDRMSTTTNQVNYKFQFTLKDYKLLNGEILNDGPVENYFIEKYPESAWISQLEESSKTQRFKR